MTKLALLIVLCTAAIGFFNTAETLDESEDTVQYEPVGDDEDERTGHVFTSASLRPGYIPSPLTPSNVVSASLQQCYVCTDCPKIQPNTTFKMCPITYDKTKSKSCVVYAEQYKHMKRPWYVRGCATERGSCSEISQSHSIHADIVKLQFCKECEGDKCNTSGASRSLSDILMAFLALIVTPLIAKYTLT